VTFPANRTKGDKFPSIKEVNGAAKKSFVKNVFSAAALS
jgi:hypothetical protein